MKELEEKYRHQVNYTEEEILELEPVLTEESGFGYSRRKRDVETEFLSELNCGQTKCTFISCVIGPLEKKGFTLIKIRSRLWVRTLDKIKRNDVEISSKLVTKVTKLPYGVNPEYLGFKTHHVTTQVEIFRYFLRIHLDFTKYFYFKLIHISIFLNINIFLRSLISRLYGLCI